MDYTQRSSELIYKRLTEVAQMWPENSRSYWSQMEREDVSMFNRRALSTGLWSPGPCRYKTIEFWDSVAVRAVEQCMSKFRLLVLQTDCMRRLGCDSWREEVWLQIVVGQDVWEDPRYDYYFM